ncbi:hypothetical protein BU14_0176s0049 [Porphyra umbilicalis]|uniref:Pherophorin domain-containing protein n=1 Tax=Porphyra umbilicalis TaxID=2786 RepID=A0A1X6P7K2_PORUM|nr:hypothetical protein BU14_0176s0049 [Porphyra umbilicalis]|eukprot:OSX76807.1 hypothetical protein BU14_0176s0049 [Porphyra umbilicalis]
MAASRQRTSPRRPPPPRRRSALVAAAVASAAVAAVAMAAFTPTQALRNPPPPTPATLTTSTCACKTVNHGVCAAALPTHPGSCTYTRCPTLVCDDAGTATCVRRVRMAYFLTEPVPPPAGEEGGGGGDAPWGAAHPASDAPGGVWACTRTPTVVMEPAWACASDPPLTCDLRSDAAAAAAGAVASTAVLVPAMAAAVPVVAAAGAPPPLIVGRVTLTTAPDCGVGVAAAVSGLRPGAAYRLTMTRSGQVGDAPWADAAGGGGMPTARHATTTDGGGGDAYDPTGGSRSVAWRLVAGGGGVAILNAMERGLGVGEAAGRGLRLDVVGRGGGGGAVARCVVGYAELAP